MQRIHIPSVLVIALPIALLAACAAPTPAPSATPTSPPPQASPATITATASPAPSATRTFTPTPTASATAIPAADLAIRPETLAQLRLAWTIDEPGNPNAQAGCQDTACWLPSRIGAYAFSPDGDRLAVSVCLGDPTENVTNPRHYRFVCPTASEVRLYDAVTGELQSSFSVGGYPISLAFHPDGNVLAAGMADRQIEVWDLTAEKKIHQLDHSSTRDGVVSLTFSSDGTQLISAGDDKIQVWDWETPLMLARIDGVTGVSLSPDGGRLATRFFGGTRASAFMGRIYDLEDMPHFREIDFHSFMNISRVLLTPDGSTLVAFYPGGVEFWDPQTETYLGKINLTTQFVDLGINFSGSDVFTPDGYLIVEPFLGPAPGPDATPWPPGLDEYYCGFGLWDPRTLGLYTNHISFEECDGPDRQFASDDPYRAVIDGEGLRLAADDGYGRLRVWAVDPSAPAAAPECLGSCEESALAP